MEDGPAKQVLLLFVLTGIDMVHSEQYMRSLNHHSRQQPLLVMIKGALLCTPCVDPNTPYLCRISITQRHVCIETGKLRLGQLSDMHQAINICSYIRTSRRMPMHRNRTACTLKEERA